MADMVASTVAQEVVSRASSYISTKLEDKASRVHNMARLEMALYQLEYALERAEKMPITYTSLLRRMKMLKSAYAEGTDLLNKHKQAMEGGHDAAGRAVTRYPLLEWIGRAKNLATSLLGLNEDHYLSSTAVQIFEWYADCADKFVTNLESGCPFGRGTFRYPFVRQLLKGKTLWYESIRGSSHRMYFHMLPLRSDDRGVEAELFYYYQDLRSIKNNFDVSLMLRLSESTDIVGTVIKCMKQLTSQLKLVIESAVGELALLPDLQDVPHSYAPPLGSIQHTYAIRHTKMLRPDPICCSVNGPRDLTNNIISLESSNQVLESVIAIGFGCCTSAPEYKLRDTNAPSPPLYLEAFLVPHMYCAPEQEMIVLKYNDKEEYKNGGMQQMEEIVGSNALDYLVLEPQATRCDIFWFSAHGTTFINLRKSINDEAPGRGRNAAKRKR